MIQTIDTMKQEMNRLTVELASSYACIREFGVKLSTKRTHCCCTILSKQEKFNQP